MTNRIYIFLITISILTISCSKEESNEDKTSKRIDTEAKAEKAIWAFMSAFNGATSVRKTYNNERVNGLCAGYALVTGKSSKEYTGLNSSNEKYINIGVSTFELSNNPTYAKITCSIKANGTIYYTNKEYSGVQTITSSKVKFTGDLEEDNISITVSKYTYFDWTGRITTASGTYTVKSSSY